MRPKIIIDPGSCHCGSAVMAGQFIDLAADLGVDAVKFQLFPQAMYPGNCALPYEAFPILVEHGKEAGVEVFASTFEVTGRHLAMLHCDSIKFAHGRHQGIDECVGKMTVYASYSYLDAINPDTIALYAIPEYPVPYQVAFTRQMFTRFAGFSDHTLSIEQTVLAAEYGARVIEKHVRLDSDKCDAWPDGRFAIYPNELEELMSRLDAL